MRLVWDETGKRTFETGVDHGIVYPTTEKGDYGTGYAWNGLTSITESPSGAEPTNLYADNIKYLTLLSAEDFGGTINAYSYPPEFELCDGTAELGTGVTIAQQPRKVFGMVYRTKIGTDTLGQDAGYKLHLIYGALASPSEKTRDTINESPSAVEFSWTFTTTPVNVTGHSATAHLTIDSTKVDKEKLQKIEDALFGTESEEPKLLMPDEIVSILQTTSLSL